MSKSELQDQNRGRRTDYVLGTELGWNAFEVVRFTAVEGLDELYAYDIVLGRAADAPPLDITGVVDRAASFRVATEGRWRVVHGIVAEAELVDHTETMVLYRAVVVPHVWRSDLGQRSRTFVDKSIKEIVSAVLEQAASGGTQGRGLSELSGQPTAPPEEPSFESFSPAAGQYRWAVGDTARLEEPRAFVVQYAESDFRFVCRLLEAEGVSYFFEHTADSAVMTLSDRPGHAPLFERDARHELVTGVAGRARNQEVVRSHRKSRRVRAGSVVMRDYRWRASQTPFEAQSLRGGPADVQHFEFPAKDEDSASPGEGPATFLAERHAAEAAMTQGYATVRTLEPGYGFTLTDKQGVREDVELLVTRVEVHAVQLLPDDSQLDLEPIGLTRSGRPDGPFYESRYHALPKDVPYRPERKTPHKEIAGVQTARVTAEEVGSATELNSDAFGRVRVRFPWDQREPDGTPSSKWVRVAQYWAGPGFGAQYVPRVGHEVLVAFERGDPDRPIIVGRVYNAQNPPPYPEPNTTKSTIKSDSVGEDGASANGFNELRFDDAASKEQVFLHAQRNFDEVVRANHTTTVGGDQTNTVGGDQTNTVYGSRTHDVNGTELVHVVGDRTTKFDADEYHTVTGSRITEIGASDVHLVKANHDRIVGAGEKIEVTGAQTMKVTGERTLSVGTDHTVRVGGQETTNVVGARRVYAGSDHTFMAPKHMFMSEGFWASIAPKHNIDSSESTVIYGGAAKIEISSGFICIDNGAGAKITLAGGSLIIQCADYACTAGGLHKTSAGAAATTTAGMIVDTAPLIRHN